MQRDVWTLAETAEYLRVSKPTLSRLARDGLLDPLPMPHRLLFASTTVKSFVLTPRPLKKDKPR